MTILMNIQAQYPSMDDARLAHQARADPEAFAEPYRRHVRSVYRYHLADGDRSPQAYSLFHRNRPTPCLRCSDRS
jgi:hypothetical protein